MACLHNHPSADNADRCDCTRKYVLIQRPRIVVHPDERGTPTRKFISRGAHPCRTDNTLRALHAPVPCSGISWSQSQAGHESEARATPKSAHRSGHPAELRLGRAWVVAAPSFAGMLLPLPSRFGPAGVGAARTDFPPTDSAVNTHPPPLQVHGRCRAHPAIDLLGRNHPQLQTTALLRHQLGCVGA